MRLDARDGGLGAADRRPLNPQPVPPPGGRRLASWRAPKLGRPIVRGWRGRDPRAQILLPDPPATERIVRSTPGTTWAWPTAARVHICWARLH
eukprot:scaffold347_cov380-Prasinococcus_capsulatus_cf.AAC.23